MNPHEAAAIKRKLEFLPSVGSVEIHADRVTVNYDQPVTRDVARAYEPFAARYGCWVRFVNSRTLDFVPHATY